MLKLKADMKIYLKNCKCKIAKIIAEKTLYELELLLEKNFSHQTAIIVKKQIEEVFPSGDVETKKEAVSTNSRPSHGKKGL